MRSQLIEAGLWAATDSGDPEREITAAWRVLARLGYPGRSAGHSQRGRYEYMIVNPRSGELLTSGEGETLAAAICKAALTARSFIATTTGLTDDAGLSTSH